MFKVGDKVKIKSYDTLLKEYGGREKLLKTTLFVDGMQECCGTEGIVTRVDDVTQYVTVNDYIWQSDMLETVRKKLSLEELGFEKRPSYKNKHMFIKKDKGLEIIIVSAYKDDTRIMLDIDSENLKDYGDAIKKLYDDVADGVYDGL